MPRKETNVFELILVIIITGFRVLIDELFIHLTIIVACHLYVVKAIHALLIHHMQTLSLLYFHLPLRPHSEWNNGTPYKGVFHFVPLSGFLPPMEHFQKFHYVPFCSIPFKPSNHAGSQTYHPDWCFSRCSIFLN